jgi:uncharacterized protein YjiS (DUF1127 family)
MPGFSTGNGAVNPIDTQKTHQLPIGTQSVCTDPWGESLMLIGILFDTVRRYLRYRDNVVCITQLDEHILRDIGLSRDELSAEAWARAVRVEH